MSVGLEKLTNNTWVHETAGFVWSETTAKLSALHKLVCRLLEKIFNAQRKPIFRLEV